LKKSRSTSRRNKSWRTLLVAVLVFLSLIALGVFGLWRYMLTMTVQVPSQGMVFEIAPGVPIQRVARDLESAGVLPSSLWVRAYVRLNPEVNHFRAGEYLLEPGLTLPQLIKRFVDGKILDYPIQFVEGWTFADALQELARHSKLMQKTEGQSPQEIMAALGRPDSHPEGQFFPDTYRYHKGMSDIDVLTIAMQRMDWVLNQEWPERQEGLPIKSPYEALILASIIEKETGVAHERGKIAGVFVRRLEKGMRLQTDPTVIYGLGERYAGNLTRKNLREETEYNTYRISGLPPTPIALPGREAIHAALHPEAGKELFFVARGDGSHEFTATLAEHREAVLKYQIRERRSDYRSRPDTSTQGAP